MVETPNTFADLVSILLSILSALIPVIFAITFVYVVWRIIDTWVIHANDAESIKTGRSFVIIAILVLVLMVSVWGVVELLSSSFFGT